MGDLTTDTTAYVDESVRLGGAGVYVVAAVVVSQVDHEAIRASLRGLLRAKQPRFHWRAEQHVQRMAMLTWMADRRLPSFGIVYAPMRGVHQERARRLCLERLLWELRTTTGSVVFERRGNAGDARDRQTIGQAQRSHVAPFDLSHTAVTALDEPLLWLPDALAGAVALDRDGVVGGYLDVVRDHVALHDIGR